MPISDTDLLKMIKHFIPGEPLSYKLHEDGSLVVIAESGKKFTFSADQVASVHHFMKPKSKSAVTTSKRHTTKREVEAAPAPKAELAGSGRISRMPSSHEVEPKPSKTVSKPKST